MPKTEFQYKLRRWYEENKRDLPWRHTNDPYRIWLSEVILQQTRVNQGRPYYEKFVRNYPDVHSLAGANANRVMKDWEGLGYYSRARNMHEAARYISRELKGVFPGSYEDILKLKGVGEYTASAVASFAYGEAQAVLDGNVYRVLSRYLGIDKPVNKAKKDFSQAAREMLDMEDPAQYNQAIMEFGALQCVPRNPGCQSCVLSDSCYAFQNEKVNELPNKEKTKYDRQRYFYYLLLDDNKRTLVRQRTDKGIWRGLFEFPLIEAGEEKELQELILLSEFKCIIKDKPDIIGFYVLKPHKLSHQTIHCSILHIAADDLGKEQIDASYIVKEWPEMDQLAFPRPLRRFLNSPEKQMTLHMQK